MIKRVGKLIAPYCYRKAVITMNGHSHRAVIKPQVLNSPEGPILEAYERKDGTFTVIINTVRKGISKLQMAALQRKYAVHLK